MILLRHLQQKNLTVAMEEQWQSYDEVLPMIYSYNTRRIYGNRVVVDRKMDGKVTTNEFWLVVA